MAWVRWLSWAGLVGFVALFACSGCQMWRGSGASAKAPIAAANLYVATNGNDAWSGRLSAPNAEKTDGPFATLERARDELRKLKASGALSGNGASVVVRGRGHAAMTAQGDTAMQIELNGLTWASPEHRFSKSRPCAATGDGRCRCSEIWSSSTAIWRPRMLRPALRSGRRTHIRGMTITRGGVARTPCGAYTGTGP